MTSPLFRYTTAIFFSFALPIFGETDPLHPFLVAIAPRAPTGDSPVQPGIQQGSYLNGMVRIAGEKLGGARLRIVDGDSRPVPFSVIFRDGVSIGALVAAIPDPGVLWVSAIGESSESAPLRLNGPEPRWLSPEKARPGGQIRILGLNLARNHAAFAGIRPVGAAPGAKLQIVDALRHA